MSIILFSFSFFPFFFALSCLRLTHVRTSLKSLSRSFFFSVCVCWINYGARRKIVEHCASAGTGTITHTRVSLQPQRFNWSIHYLSSITLYIYECLNFMIRTYPTPPHCKSLSTCIDCSSAAAAAHLKSRIWMLTMFTPFYSFFVIDWLVGTRMHSRTVLLAFISFVGVSISNSSNDHQPPAPKKDTDRYVISFSHFKRKCRTR